LELGIEELPELGAGNRFRRILGGGGDILYGAKIVNIHWCLLPSPLGWWKLRTKKES
jgi:hypothetical protein